MARDRLGPARRQLVDVIRRLDPRAGVLKRARPEDRSVEDLLEALEGATDVTEERARLLQAQVDRLEVAASHIGDGIVLCDPNGEIIFRNAQAEAYAGARHGDALAERALVDLLGRALQGEVGSEPLDLWGPPRRTLNLSARPLLAPDGGAVVGALAIVEDVSERRRLDNVRRDFVANISHELKTPVGALSLLADAIMGETDLEVVHRLASRFQLESERLAHIIEDLLDLSRIEAEEKAPHEAIPVSSILGEAVDRLETTAEHQDVDLVVVPGAEGFVVVGDRRDLVSAVHNLLENAVKYSDAGAKVVIEVVATDESPVHDGVAIRISDEGIGIPARDLERIFERFYRVDRARARETGGTGLGLAIVRHVAQNHGGDVTVTSREGEGSCFSLLLPSTPARPVHPSKPHFPTLGANDD